MRAVSRSLALFMLVSVVSISLAYAAAPRPPRDPVAIDPPLDNGDKTNLGFRRSLDDGNGANNVVQYVIRCAPQGQSLQIVGYVNANGSATYNYLVTGLQAGQTYDFGITATNGSQESSMVTVSSTTVDSKAPRPPRDLVAIDPKYDNGDKIRLSFRRSLDDGNGAGDVAFYTVSLRVTGQPFAPVGTIPATGADIYNHYVTGLTRNQAYGFGVTCTDSSGNVSTMVTVWKTPTDTSAPGPPQNLRGVDPATSTGDRIRLYWDRSVDDSAAGDVQSYFIYERTPGVPFVQVATVPATQSNSYTYLVTGLTRNQRYGLGVAASDGINKSDTVVVWITPTDTCPPRPVTSLTAVDPANTNGDRIRLYFDRSLDDGTGSKDVVAYHIWQRLPGQPFAQVGEVAASGLAKYTYMALGLQRNQNYGFGVTAFDGVNESDRVVVWKTPTDTRPPRPVSHLVATDVPNDNGEAINLTFNRSLDDGSGSNDVVSYRVQTRTAGQVFSDAKSVPASGADNYVTIVSGLTAGLNTGFSVCAFDGVNYSDPVVVWATPVDNTPPRPPQGLTATAPANDDGTILQLTFQASPDDVAGHPEVTSYRIYRSTSPVAVGLKVGNVPATQAASYQYQDTGLTAGTAYYYLVYSVAATGVSDPSNQATGTPTDTRPVLPPTNLTAQDHPYDTGGAIDLAWDRSGDDGAGLDHVRKYFIYRKMANVTGNPTKIATVTATGATSYKFTDTTVPMDLILYEYTVTAVSDGNVESTPAGPAQAASEDNNVVVFQPPTNLSVSDVPADAGGQLLLTWNRSTSEGDIGPPPPPPVVFSQSGYGGQYEFYRRTAGGTFGTVPTFIVSADGTQDPMTYTDTGLTDGVTYYYKARYRRYNQISDFTPVVSATPIANLSLGSMSAAGSAGSVVGTAPATGTASGLAVQLANLPDTVQVGNDLPVVAKVSAQGASQVYLQYSIAGGPVTDTAAVSGQDAYSANFRLRTSHLPIGTKVTIRAVVVQGQSNAVSAPVTVTVTGG